MALSIQLGDSELHIGGIGSLASNMHLLLLASVQLMLSLSTSPCLRKAVPRTSLCLPLSYCRYDMNCIPYMVSQTFVTIMGRLHYLSSEGHSSENISG
jgi:hypothetical protein